MKQKIIVFAFLFFATLQLFAQSEFVEFYPLFQMRNVSKSASINNNNSSLSILPFFDDFAYPFMQPLSSLWSDSYAIVNSSFAKNPLTIGEVTLDALNNKGRLYENASTNPSISDYLTSQPINLKTYQVPYASDKLYIKNGVYSLLDDNYFLYDSQTFSYTSVTQGLIFYAGDTVYEKVGNSYIAIQDSLYVNNVTYTYIVGSYLYEPQIYSYSLLDSLALSFYFQSGGNGDLPEAQDSLVLEFYVPSANQGIFINEVTTNWIEIYNATDSVVSLANYFIITDTLQEIISQNKLPNCKISLENAPVISPYSHGIIYASEIGLPKITQLYVYLYSPDTIAVDSVVANTEVSELSSFARIPDGNLVWSYSTINTPLECNPAWKHIWSSNKNTGDVFEYAYIPITNAAFLQKGFRFRFKNYTSLSNDESHARNEDFWNIDMVWFDAHRKPAVANIADVAFVEEFASLYSAFKAIPIEHFQNVEVTDFKMTVDSKCKNFDSDYRKVKYNFAVQKKHVDDELLFPTFEIDIPAYTLVEKHDILSDWNVEFVDFMKSDIGLYDEASYEFQYFVTDNNNPIYKQYRWNDTNRVQLTMSNYYAYDDGIPEAGYGLREAPMGKVAYKFDVLQPDTLKAINIYFNPTLATSPPIFNLCVWNVNTDGTPGELLYYMPSEKVQFANGIYNFVTYKIKDEGILTGDKNGVFIEEPYFVGWEQPYDVLLNIGLDVSSTLNNKMYYNLGFEWLNSSQKGALLLRPVFGKLSEAQDLPNSNQAINCIIYPTVAQNVLHVLSQGNVSIVSYVIQDITGRQLQKKSLDSNTIDISQLPNGFYTIQLRASNGEISYHSCIVKKL